MPLLVSLADGIGWLRVIRSGGQYVRSFGRFSFSEHRSRQVPAPFIRGRFRESAVRPNRIRTAPSWARNAAEISHDSHRPERRESVSCIRS